MTKMRPRVKFIENMGWEITKDKEEIICNKCRKKPEDKTMYCPTEERFYCGECESGLNHAKYIKSFEGHEHFNIRRVIEMEE